MNPNKLSRWETAKVIAGLGSIAAFMSGAVVLGVNKLDQPSPFADTHPEKVTVIAGADGNTETDLADFIQKKYNTADTDALIVGRLDAQDPAHDANLDQGEKLTITVDVPDNHK